MGPPLVLALAALAIRLYNLSYHSLWFDEAMSVHWARSSLPRILEVSMNLVEDRLPPLYYLSLHYWRLLVGDGEVAVRLPSVLLGTLLIPLVYRLASDLFRDRRVALLAAALTTLNPFLVWYSQEARMYAQAVLLVTLGTWLFVKGTSAYYGRRRESVFHSTLTWSGYGLCTVAGLYTHLYTGFMLPAHALYLLLTWRRSRRAWLPFALTMLAVSLLFAPLAIANWSASSEAGPGDPLAGFWARMWWLLSAFSIWKAPISPTGATIITAGLVGFVAAGLLLVPHQSDLDSPASAAMGVALVYHDLHDEVPAYPADRARSAPRSQLQALKPRLLLTLLLLTPPLIATLLLFRSQVAFFGERYFIIVVPWLMIAAAAGAVGLAARLHRVMARGRQPSPFISPLLPRTYYLLAAILYLLPVALTVLPLPGQWSPSARKEAWRETANYLATHARPEDAILIHPDWTRYPLQYYFRGPGQTYAVLGSIANGADLDAPLNAISNAHPIVWLVESHTELADPEHKVNAWLAARYPVVTELYPPGLVAVRAYAPGYVSERLPDFARPVHSDFVGGLSLVGYAVPQAHVQTHDNLFHPPSGWIHTTLYWSIGSPVSQDYTPFVHLIDDLGQVWGASLEQSSGTFDFYPTAHWQPGQVVRSDFDVNLNPITPAGNYTLVVGLRDAAGAQVPLADSSLQLALTAVEVSN
jgi:4-amino-4-deoxy-L-arabinose transferase-like glycosyltransferase